MAGSRSAISEVGYEMRFKERVSKWKSEETRFVKRNGSDGKKARDTAVGLMGVFTCQQIRGAGVARQRLAFPPGEFGA